MQRLIVFDCDGTLVDSQHFISASMQHAFAAAGREAPAFDAVRAVIGLSLDEAVARLAPDLDDDERVAMVRAYRDAFFELRTNGEPEPLYPGCRECLLELHAGGDLLGVATGKGRRGLRAILEAHGLFDLFTTLKTADDGPGKPNPEILLLAMAECGVGPDRTLMVGDTTFDVELAVNAGIRAIGVDWGYHPASSLRAAGAVEVAESYAALPGILDRICPRS